jgi:hypothetical protein
MSWRDRHAPNPGRRIGFAGVAILSVASLVYVPVVQASCQLKEISEFHVARVGNSPVIDGQVNEQPIRILLETGAIASSITDTAAHQLDLPIREYSNPIVVGVGGIERVQSAVVKELKIGRFVLKDYRVSVIFKQIEDANGVASFQLGADFLSHFTTEWDLAHGVVRLLHPQDCKLEQLAYWSPSYFQINLEQGSLAHQSFVLEVKINGKSMKARLTSGSAFSFISPQGALDAGVEPGGPNAEAAGDITGFTPKPIPTWMGRFDTFEIGGETIRNARLRIGEVFPQSKEKRSGPLFGPGRGPAALKLGADFLQAHRLIIVPEQHVALFTYNGGAPFQERPDEAAPGEPDRALPLHKDSTTPHED